MEKVFISYRREGGEYLAGRIHDYLQTKNISVFYDIESLNVGKFNEQLYKKIEECEFFIVVLPPHALDRCVNEDDWVRLEIAKALKCKKTIIPIIMPGFEFPNDLPDDIKEIADFQGIMINNALFPKQMDNLISELMPRKKTHLPLKILISVILVISLIFGAVIAKNLFFKNTANTAVQNQNSDNAKETPPTSEPEKEKTPNVEELNEIAPENDDSYTGPPVQPDLSDKQLEIITSIISGPVVNNVFAMFDGKLSTSLQSGNAGHMFTVYFPQNEQQPFEYIQIMNGNLRTENAFYQNGRPKKIKATVNNVDNESHEYIWHLKDGYGAENIFKLEETKPTQEILFEILNDYRGDQVDIAYITDIYFLDSEQKRISLKEYSNNNLTDVIYEESSALNENSTSKNAFDRFSDTAWVEGADGHGIGEHLSVTFDSPINIQAFAYDLGCLTSEKDYFENSRPKQLKLVLHSQDGQLETITDTFTDEYNCDPFRHYAESFKNVTQIDIYIEDVFEGSTFDNTYITDIIFYDENIEIINLN